MKKPSEVASHSSPPFDSNLKLVTRHKSSNRKRRAIPNTVRPPGTAPIAPEAYRCSELITRLRPSASSLPTPTSIAFMDE
ncbi:hypothetical protein OPV22_018262 [Ensete ventricosum]|uniref:Uncharacterized protein n=1 Tax=Ensete ventricosum TaxID=4639 RepID=A0AAV8QTW3_ENSVE|nr:hypothetical protein OPV22_018262 [Ensete ventricosum]